MRYPSRDRTVEMILKTPDAKWFDNVNTSKKETLADLVNEAYKYSCDSLERRFGPINKDWNWANVKQSNVPHLAKIPGLWFKGIDDWWCQKHHKRTRRNQWPILANGNRTGQNA